MSYRDFCAHFGNIAKGSGLSAKFSKKDGKYQMQCSDGTTISMAEGSHKFTVKWGCGHTAMAEVGA